MVPHSPLMKISSLPDEKVGLETVILTNLRSPYLNPKLLSDKNQQYQKLFSIPEWTTLFHSATSIHVPVNLFCSLCWITLLTLCKSDEFVLLEYTSNETDPVELVSISLRYGATMYLWMSDSLNGEGLGKYVTRRPKEKYPFVATCSEILLLSPVNNVMHKLPNTYIYSWLWSVVECKTTGNFNTGRNTVICWL